MSRHTLDARAGVTQRDPGFAVQALADRRRQVVVQGIAYELVMERETITAIH